MTNNFMIYHYTTVSGLIGIATRRELWASDCRYLNDGTELSYGRNIYFDEVEKLKLGHTYRIAGPSLDNFRVFIACFCEEGDLLSQWRGYGADQGYALGFDTAQLQALDFGETCPVQYGIPDPSEYFKNELYWASEPTAHPGVAEWHASQWLLPRLARVKHPGFTEEREWRMLKQLAVYDLKEQGAAIQFRPSSMGPIAYLVISFPPECLQEIIIGPGSHTETREAAINDMLQYLDFHDVIVRVSKIPFRK